jgi:predicted membrane GTPase involved in stress response
VEVTPLSIPMRKAVLGASKRHAMRDKKAKE